jgi:hypothetical protein
MRYGVLRPAPGTAAGRFLEEQRPPRGGFFHFERPQRPERTTMSNPLQRRIARLEALKPPKSDKIPVFARNEDHVPKKIEEMIAAGEIAEADRHRCAFYLDIKHEMEWIRQWEDEKLVAEDAARQKAEQEKAAREKAEREKGEQHDAGQKTAEPDTPEQERAEKSAAERQNANHPEPPHSEPQPPELELAEPEPAELQPFGPDQSEPPQSEQPSADDGTPAAGVHLRT